MEESKQSSEDPKITTESPDPKEELKSTKAPKRKIEIGLILGIIALLINIITVSIYISQTSIMRSQQRASAWPRLEWRVSYVQDKGFSLEVNNNGIGPALINSIQVKLDGQEMNHLDSTYISLVGTKRFPRLSSQIENRVIPAGSSLRPIEIKNLLWAERFFNALQKHQLEYDICYESVYGEQWTCKGLTVEKGTCQ